MPSTADAWELPMPSGDSILDTSMTEDLMTIVLDRASVDSTLPEAAKLLVLAAMEGDDDLAQALDSGQGASVPERSRPEPAGGEPALPVRAYLSSVTVEGFRGVGPSATLRLQPGPGLVVVAGRNGCGKSSFAEALEVALTRGSYRWRNRPHYWHESWRNLHQQDSTSITVELAEEGRGVTKVGATWAPGAGLDDARSWVQRPGERRQPDRDAVRALVTSSVVPDGDLAQLRELAALQSPDPAVLRRAGERFQAARTTLDDLEQGARAADVRRTDLLIAALAVHRDGGDGPCPVCGTGRLDGTWAQRVEAELRQERELADARAGARAELESAARALTAVPLPAPALLAAPPAGLVTPCAAALAAWRTLSALATDADLLARDGLAALEAVRRALDAVVETAAAELQQREDRWQPVALRVAEWLGHADRAVAARDRLMAVKAAGTWLKSHAHELRNDRIRPLTERARHVWGLLRQESNVDLGEITLAGSNTSRRVELSAAVDGSRAQALGVMSQGELHALALALFLPKATAPDSPFGFVVIDDPVQAMDPAKVDGLARVLEEVARERQVVVLTHDDRLPEAVRRLGITARLVEVSRGQGSRVGITGSSDPVARYLDDARAVASDRKLPDGVQRQVVAALCRMAVEARSRDVYFARRLAAGASRTDVERAWAAATRTRSKVALALLDDANGDLRRWQSVGVRRSALDVCGSKAHDGVTGDPHHAVDDVALLVRELGGGHGG